MDLTNIKELKFQVSEPVSEPKDDKSMCEDVSKQCNHEPNKAWHCTRVKGHTGEHIGHYTDGKEGKRWNLR